MLVFWSVVLVFWLRIKSPEPVITCPAGCAMNTVALGQTFLPFGPSVPPVSAVRPLLHVHSYYLGAYNGSASGRSTTETQSHPTTVAKLLKGVLLGVHRRSKGVLTLLYLGHSCTRDPRPYVLKSADWVILARMLEPGL